MIRALSTAYRARVRPPHIHPQFPSVTGLHIHGLGLCFLAPCCPGRPVLQMAAHSRESGGHGYHFLPELPEARAQQGQGCYRHWLARPHGAPVAARGRGTGYPFSGRGLLSGDQRRPRATRNEGRTVLTSAPGTVQSRSTPDPGSGAAGAPLPSLGGQSGTCPKSKAPRLIPDIRRGECRGGGGVGLAEVSPVSTPGPGD